MLIDKCSDEIRICYCNYLKCIGMLSGLSSTNDSPFINSRVAENAFCLATHAENLSRADCSADAKLGKTGIGIKTFLANNNYTLQKIAEFNKEAKLIRDKNTEEIVHIIAELRNQRLLSTMRIYGLEEMIYHCIVREPKLIRICESAMDTIDIESIREIELKNENIITFKDDKNEYSFNLSKSTLYKRFNTANEIIRIKVEIIEEPYDFLARLLPYSLEVRSEVKVERYESVILPLFSERGVRNVPKKSGLNQWNAGGRKRDANEVYIPIPIWIHNRFPNFFPSRDEVFKLQLPNGKSLVAKVCQDGSKALMSNPNLDLGKWLLRDVMNLKKWELLTFERLQIMGIDSVEIYKLGDRDFKIDFRPIGTYDQFKLEHE